MSNNHIGSQMKNILVHDPHGNPPRHLSWNITFLTGHIQLCASSERDKFQSNTELRELCPQPGKVISRIPQLL